MTAYEYVTTLILGIFVGWLFILFIILALRQFAGLTIELGEEDDATFLHRIMEEDVDSLIANFEEWHNVRITDDERALLMEYVKDDFSSSEELYSFCTYYLHGFIEERESEDENGNL